MKKRKMTKLNFLLILNYLKLNVNSKFKSEENQKINNYLKYLNLKNLSVLLMKYKCKQIQNLQNINTIKKLK